VTNLWTDACAAHSHSGRLKLQEVLRDCWKLEELILCCNCLDDVHAAMLVQVLQRRGAALERLDLSCNALSAKTIQALVPFVACDPSQCTSTSPHHGASLKRIPSLSARSSVPLGCMLTYLDVSGNPIGDRAVKLIANAVCTAVHSNLATLKVLFDRCSCVMMLRNLRQVPEMTCCIDAVSTLAGSVEDMRTFHAQDCTSLNSQHKQTLSLWCR
jgi:Leucine Rich repeat